MYYTIEMVKKDDPDGLLLESLKRGGTPAGKAQAFAVARQLAKLNPTTTLLVSAVVGRDDKIVIGLINPNGALLNRYEDAEILDAKKTPLQKMFVKSVKALVENGKPEGEAVKELVDLLAETKI